MGAPCSVRTAKYIAALGLINVSVPFLAGTRLHLLAGFIGAPPGGALGRTGDFLIIVGGLVGLATVPLAWYPMHQFANASMKPR